MKTLALSLILVCGNLSAQTDSTILPESRYDGKNVYIQNPFSENGTGFCVTKVTVNDIVLPDSIFQSSAFEIALTAMGLRYGAPVKIIIHHKKDCKPKVLNPCIDCGTKSTFELDTIGMLPGDTLYWRTTNENGKFIFTIEQFRWNKWVKVGETNGKGGTQLNSYKFKVIPNSGENQFRVKQVDYRPDWRFSRPVKYTSGIPPVKVISTSVMDKIEFSAETLYEIYDNYNNIVKRGYGISVDCRDLSKGKYWLNYDDQTVEIHKN